MQWERGKFLSGMRDRSEARRGAEITAQEALDFPIHARAFEDLEIDREESPHERDVDAFYESVHDTSILRGLAFAADLEMDHESNEASPDFQIPDLGAPRKIDVEKRDAFNEAFTEKLTRLGLAKSIGKTCADESGIIDAEKAHHFYGDALGVTPEFKQHISHYLKISVDRLDALKNLFHKTLIRIEGNPPRGALPHIEYSGVDVYHDEHTLFDKMMDAADFEYLDDGERVMLQEILGSVGKTFVDSSASREKMAEHIKQGNEALLQKDFREHLQMLDDLELAMRTFDDFTRETAMYKWALQYAQRDKSFLHTALEQKAQTSAAAAPRWRKLSVALAIGEFLR